MTQKFEIEKGIPIPLRNAIRRNRLYPEAEDLAIGDSFLIDSGDAKQDLGLSNGVHGHYKTTKIKVSVRKTDEGFRVWRVS